MLMLQLLLSLLMLLMLKLLVILLLLLLLLVLLQLLLSILLLFSLLSSTGIVCYYDFRADVEEDPRGVTSSMGSITPATSPWLALEEGMISDGAPSEFAAGPRSWRSACAQVWGRPPRAPARIGVPDSAIIPGGARNRFGATRESPDPVAIPKRNPVPAAVPEHTAVQEWRWAYPERVLHPGGNRRTELAAPPVRRQDVAVAPLPV